MAYHLISGLYAQLTARSSFNILVLGLDNAGKTVRRPNGPPIQRSEPEPTAPQTFLEQVKTTFTDEPGVSPDKIVPTIGQNSPSPFLRRLRLGREG